jgi:hypothetical protein
VESEEKVILKIELDPPISQWLDEEAVRFGYDSAEAYVGAWIKSQANTHKPRS